MTIEEALTRLEEIGLEIRLETTSIARQAELYAEGSELARFCETALDALRSSVRLVDPATGETREAPELAQSS